MDILELRALERRLEVLTKAVQSMVTTEEARIAKAGGPSTPEGNKHYNTVCMLDELIQDTLPAIAQSFAELKPEIVYEPGLDPRQMELRLALPPAAGEQPQCLSS